MSALVNVNMNRENLSIVAQTENSITKSAHVTVLFRNLTMWSAELLLSGKPIFVDVPAIKAVNYQQTALAWNSLIAIPLCATASVQVKQPNCADRTKNSKSTFASANVLQLNLKM